jgi:hypothetical protein
MPRPPVARFYQFLLFTYVQQHVWYYLTHAQFLDTLTVNAYIMNNKTLPAISFHFFSTPHLMNVPTINHLYFVLLDAIFTTSVVKLNSRHHLTQWYQHENKWFCIKDKNTVKQWARSRKPCNRKAAIRERWGIPGFRKGWTWNHWRTALRQMTDLHSIPKGSWMWIHEMTCESSYTQTVRAYVSTAGICLYQAIWTQYHIAWRQLQYSRHLEVAQKNSGLIWDTQSNKQIKSRRLIRWLWMTIVDDVTTFQQLH